MRDPAAMPTPDAAADSPEGSLLDELVESPSAPLPQQVAPSTGHTMSQWVGQCIDVEHPTLRGRILVRWETEDGSTEAVAEHWLPCLHHVVARPADRVLITRASNSQEAIIVGVIDGFSRRPETPRQDAAVVVVKADERLLVRAHDGTPLVEVHQQEEGPVVRVLSESTNLELAGTLRLEADGIELRAKRGMFRIEASDDVDINGEMIHLNSPQQPVVTGGVTASGPRR